MFFEISIFFLAITISFCLSFLIVFSSIMLVSRSTDIEKISSYECGFHPFQDTRNQIDIRFYLVAMLFLIFDLELTFLFPWALVLTKVGLFGYALMIFFLWLLILGFFFEWNNGALEWE